MNKTIVLALSFLFVNQFIFAQTDDGRTTDAKILEVSKGIYIYQNKGGNIGLSIGTDGVFMIDDQFAEISEDLLKDVKRLSRKPLKFVLNTHHHGDHTGGNANMYNEGATLLAHTNVRQRLKEYIEGSDEKIDPNMLPGVTFNDGLTFYFNQEEIAIYYLPKAHTDGDVMVHFTSSNVLHTGDAFVKARYPFIDSRNGGTVEGYIAGLEKILSKCDRDTKIIPGHGEVSNMQDVRELKRMMDVAWQRVTFFHLQGKSEAEIVSMKTFTKEFDDKGYGDHFITREQFLRAVYKEVAVEYDQSDYKNKKEMIERIKKKQEGGQ